MQQPLEILYVDNHQLAVNKPAGMVTQVDAMAGKSLEEYAKEWVKTTYNKPGNVFLEAVHRLDKPASGIVLFARTSKALSRLQEAMRRKEFRKVYLAWVQSPPPEESGTLEHYLVHESHYARIATPADSGAKLACLRYRILEVKQEYTLLEITLETGRYHQIRAQLAAIGLPILGDTRYGSLITWRPQTIALHHSCMEYPHPITQKAIRITAPHAIIFD